MRGAHRGVWCSKGTPLIEAELFAAQGERPAQNGRALLCAAVYAREIQGITATYKLKNARNRAPVTPVSLHISDVSAQRKVRGVKRGQETIRCPVPFCPSPWARRSPPVNTGTPRRRSAAIVRALRGRKAASTGCAAVSAEGLPSADGIKERADARWGTICKMFTFEPLTQDEKTAYII